MRIFARYKEGKYQLLVEGDDMSQGSVEGSWIECGSSDIRVDPELPIGRTDEAVQVCIMYIYYLYISYIYTNLVLPSIDVKSLVTCLCDLVTSMFRQNAMGHG